MSRGLRRFGATDYRENAAWASRGAQRPLALLYACLTVATRALDRGEREATAVGNSGFADLAGFRRYASVARNRPIPRSQMWLG